MKIIDLLNKISNGEELPRMIKYRDSVFIWNENHYLSKDDYSTTLLKILELSYELNDEIEIIEEPKKIEKLNLEVKIDKDIGCWKNINNLFLGIVILNEKLNKIIDYINSKEDK